MRAGAPTSGRRAASSRTRPPGGRRTPSAPRAPRPPIGMAAPAWAWCRPWRGGIEWVVSGDRFGAPPATTQPRAWGGYGSSTQRLLGGDATRWTLAAGSKTSPAADTNWCRATTRPAATCSSCFTPTCRRLSPMARALRLWLLLVVAAGGGGLFALASGSVATPPGEVAPAVGADASSTSQVLHGLRLPRRRSWPWRRRFAGAGWCADAGAAAQPARRPYVLGVRRRLGGACSLCCWRRAGRPQTGALSAARQASIVLVFALAQRDPLAPGHHRAPGHAPRLLPPA